ncbi:hypothetical protein BT96DRAFT_998193 [Gymnopus androsaceus JB14]|uniref:Uncharacterized protein n=1 Tax=Gymnopus androsaceus JB14 TaxID=1447944 RepID=A0A6A4HAV8_9AGAR|nr:hypothetical protein BT96DRAFT_998193 [Gymnopus androsaceus JB14]
MLTSSFLLGSYSNYSNVRYQDPRRYDMDVDADLTSSSRRQSFRAHHDDRDASEYSHSFRSFRDPRQQQQRPSTSFYPTHPQHSRSFSGAGSGPFRFNVPDGDNGTYGDRDRERPSTATTARPGTGTRPSTATTLPPLASVVPSSVAPLPPPPTSLARPGSNAGLGGRPISSAGLSGILSGHGNSLPPLGSSASGTGGFTSLPALSGSGNSNGLRLPPPNPSGFDFRPGSRGGSSQGLGSWAYRPGTAPALGPGAAAASSQNIMSALDLAWVSGGKMIVHPLEIRPSRSMHHHSVAAPPQTGNVGSQPSRKEMEMMRVENRDRSQENSALWSSVHPEMQQEGLDGMILAWTYEDRRHPIHRHQEPMERDSSSVEQPDSTLEIATTGRETQPRGVTSYSNVLRMQQEDQLRRARERVQAHLHFTPPIPTPPPPPPSPHHLGHLLQHHPHYPPMPLDHQHQGHIGHLAHLVRPSSQISMGMDMGMDDMHLGLSMGNMDLAGGMGAQTQAIPEIRHIQGDIQAVDLPAPTYPQAPP